MTWLLTFNHGFLTFLLILVTAGMATTSAFQLPAITGAPSRTPPSFSSTRLSLFSNPKSESFTARSKNFYKRNLTYGEDSRKYRRTVYTHEDWQKHRSPNRLFYNLSTIFSSGVYKSILGYVAATTAVATFVCIWNANKALPRLFLPLAPFTLSSPSLGLLLVFKTNTGYSRWDEARKNWGMNINHARDLCRMGNSLYNDRNVSQARRQQDLNTLALCTWAFCRAMKRQLSPAEEDEEAFQAELYEKLPTKQAKGIIQARHRPNRALQDLSTAIENLEMHFMRKDKLHSSVTKFEDNLGGSERLLSSPVPLFYTRHTARFLSIWLLLLPLGLYDVFAEYWSHWAMVPASTIISMFLFGIEELSTQLEEPFTILPMQAFCDKIYTWCTEIVSWKPGDTGMQIRDTRQEHGTMNGIDGMAS